MSRFRLAAALGLGALAGLARRGAGLKTFAAPAAPHEPEHTTPPVSHPTLNVARNAGLGGEMRPGQKEALFTQRFKPFVLGEVINLSSDVAIFRFLTPHEDDIFELEPCCSLQAIIKTDGASTMIEQVQRFYTPITPNGAKGYFDIIVRKYPGGRMTEHLFSLEVGDRLYWRMIHTKLRYLPNRWKEVGLIGGGTGITSLLQVIRANCANPADNTKMSLLYANRSDKKILLKGLLDELSKENARKFKVTYCVDRVEAATTATESTVTTGRGNLTHVKSPAYEGYIGYITPAMVEATMPKPDKDNIILVCGPDKMMSTLCGTALAVLKAMSGGLAFQPMHSGLGNLGELSGTLKELGYKNEEVYRF